MIKGRQVGYRVRAAVVADMGKLNPYSEATGRKKTLEAHSPSKRRGGYTVESFGSKAGIFGRFTTA